MSVVPDVTPFTPDVPGRSCWRLAGGCLPGTPGSTSRVGYFRLAVAPERVVGSAWNADDKSDSAHCVNQGVKVIQHRLNMLVKAGLVEDGEFGPKTDAAVRVFQKANSLAVDGVVGPNTMRAVLRALLLASATKYNVPIKLLTGLAFWESGLDPAGVGSNGWDHGVVQINLDPVRGHGKSISWGQAMDPEYSFDWAARELRATYDKWNGKTAADPQTGIHADAWDIAIANHNSPALAIQWAQQGFPPLVFRADGTPRQPQIGEYVADVKRAG